jgi:hypothetical protein
MAKFIVNTTGDKAIRKDSILSLSILGIEGGYYLQVKTSDRVLDITFETDTTLEGIQAKGAIIIASLEE